eukprot:m.24823 g.24823  ORF g.24823 m.24823 type:complete len:127 (-) comp8642_c0_seq2:2803-3183(-)
MPRPFSRTLTQSQDQSTTRSSSIACRTCSMPSASALRTSSSVSSPKTSKKRPSSRSRNAEESIQFHADLVIATKEKVTHVAASKVLTHANMRRALLLKQLWKSLQDTSASVSDPMAWVAAKVALPQ